MCLVHVQACVSVCESRLTWKPWKFWNFCSPGIWTFTYPGTLAEPILSQCWSITISSYLSSHPLISLFCSLPFLILWFLSQGVNLAWWGSGGAGLPSDLKVQGGATCLYVSVQSCAPVPVTSSYRTVQSTHAFCVRITKIILEWQDNMIL